MVRGVRHPPPRYSTVYRNGYWRILDSETGQVLAQRYIMHISAARDVERIEARARDESEKKLPG